MCRPGGIAKLIQKTEHFPIIADLEKCPTIVDATAVSSTVKKSVAASMSPPEGDPLKPKNARPYSQFLLFSWKRVPPLPTPPPRIVVP
jgi:hypothetical protein